MKFSDIDFSALSRIMDSMSDEEKDNLNKMAQNMMGDLKPNEATEEENDDFYAYLHIQEEDYQDMPGSVLDAMEAACDLEQYYEEDHEADFSASVLFYCKAMLYLLRAKHFPIYKNVLQQKEFGNAQMTTLQQYLLPLMNEDCLHQLVDEGFGNSQDWLAHQACLQQLSILLSRAEYDFIRYEDLQTLKDLLFKEKGLLRVTKLI